MDTDKQEMRQYILQATAKLLVENGQGKVRVSDVAEAAYVAAPTIYYHFGSLNRLVAEAQELIYQQLSAPLKESLSQAERALEDGDPERFWNVIGTHLKLAWQSGQRGDESGVIKVLTGVLSSHDTKQKFEHMIDETYERWSIMITEGKRRGWVIADADTEALIAIFWAASVGQAFLGGARMRASSGARVRDAFLHMSRANFSASE